MEDLSDCFAVPSAMAHIVIDAIVAGGLKPRRRKPTAAILDILHKRDQKAVEKLIGKSRLKSRATVKAKDIELVGDDEKPLVDETATKLNICIAKRVGKNIAIFTPDSCPIVRTRAKEGNGTWIPEIGCWFFKFGDHKATRTACRLKWDFETERADASEIRRINDAVARRQTELKNGTAKKKKPAAKANQRKFLLGSVASKLLESSDSEIVSAFLIAMDAHITRESDRALFKNEFKKLQDTLSASA